MSATTKSSTQLLGSGGSAATIGHGGTPVTSTALSMSTDFDAALACRVSTTTAPTANSLVQFQWSPDGTTFFNDSGPFVVPLTSGTSTDYSYLPPPAATAARVVVTNPDTTVDVSALAYGCSLDTVG